MFTFIPTEEQQVIFDRVLKDGLRRMKIKAGPGTGKTTTLVQLVNRILSEKKAKPEEILFLTFSRESKKDIQKKFFELVKQKEIKDADLEKLEIFTFHSFCNMIRFRLKEDFEKIRDATLLDDEGQFIRLWLTLGDKIQSDKEEDSDEETDRVITEAWKGQPEEKWFNSDSNDNVSDELDVESDNEKFEIEKLANKFNVIKENYKQIFGTEKEYSDATTKLLGAYLGYYASERKNLETLDFGLLLRLILEELEKHPKIKLKFSHYKYVFVDEFQDTNQIQYELLNLITNDNTTLIVVGDENQSIYGFRGSDSSIFRNFSATGNNLTLNRRSTSEIIGFGNQLLDNKTVKPSEKTKNGLPPIIESFASHVEEEKHILELIQKLIIRGYKYSDIAILTTSFSNEKIINLISLIKNNVGEDKIEIESRGTILQKKEIQSIRTIIYSVYKNNDNELKIAGLAEAKESFGLGKSIQDLHDNYVKKKSILVLFYDILHNSKFYKNCDDYSLSILSSFANIIQTFENRLVKDLIDYNWRDKLYHFYLYLKDREKNLDNKNPYFESNRIKVLTFWGAKGLEFPIVIIPNVTKSSFPRSGFTGLQAADNQLMRELLSNYDAGDEKQRAFYVGVTRPKQLLYISFSGGSRAHFLETFPVSNQQQLNAEIVSFHIKDIEKLVPEHRSEKSNDLTEISWGAFSTFIDCGYKYNLLKNYEFPLPSSSAVNFGQLIHQYIRKYNIKIKRGEKIYNNTINDLFFDLRPDNPSLTALKNQITNYHFAYNNRLRTTSFLESEKRFLRFYDDVFVNGAVDLQFRENNDLVIVEIKSGKNKENRLERAKKQALFYTVMLDDPRIKSVEVFFTSENNPRMFKITGGEKAKIEEEIRETIKKIKSNQFNPNLAHCKKCDYAKIGACKYSPNSIANNEENDEISDLQELVIKEADLDYEV